MNNEHALVLDFRDQTSFEKGHILGAKHTKMVDIIAKDSKYKRLKNKRSIIIVHQPREKPAKPHRN